MSTAKSRANNGHQDKGTHRGPKRARTEFDDSDEGSCGRNRHRVTRACNECRRRKDRCGGQKPACKSCVESNRLCSYGPSKKRGLRPGYVRAIEALLGLMITTIEGSEAWICGLLQGRMEQTSLRPAISQVQESNISVDFLIEAWRKGALANEAGKLLAPERVEVDEDGADSTQYFDTKVVEALVLSQSSRAGDTSALLTPMNTDTTPQEVALFDTPHTPVASDDAPGYYEETPRQPSTFPQPEYSVSGRLAPYLLPHPPLPNHWSYLMDIYFETTHSWLPISQKHELLRTAYTVANSSPTCTTSPSSGELAFLHAVLIYASHQTSSIKGSSKPVLDPTYRPGSSQTLTQCCLFADPAAYDLGHVRAFLVLSLLEMDQNRWAAAWNTIGRAIYTATSIGLIERTTSRERVVCGDDSKRTLLGCATLETIISARLKTLTCLQSPDISLQSLLTTDGMEEWEPWQPKILIDTGSIPNQQISASHTPGHVISTFNRLLQVMGKLNSLIHQRKKPLSDESLHDIMLACQQNLLSHVPTAVDVPPQILCLWMTSVVTMEFAATARLASQGTSSGRPDGYWKGITSLVTLIDTRIQALGCCSVSPVIRSCLELLQESMARHQLQYGDVGIEEDFIVLRRTISAAITSLHIPPREEPQMDVVPGSQLGSMDRSAGFSNSLPPTFIRDSVPPQSDRTPRMPTENLTLGKLLEVMESSIGQDQVSTNTTQQSPSEKTSMLFETAQDSVGNEMEDDGLFDSLATLDSTEW